MRSRCERHWLRTTFDDAPQLYARTRPNAPPEIFEDLAALAQLQDGSRLVEIGCGTGQATLPLAQRGYEILAIELGEQLAAHARRTLASFPTVRIVNSAFESWNPAGEQFDAVVAFNSWHWVDPEVRYAKAAEILDEHGSLAVVSLRDVTPDNPDPFWTDVQEDYLMTVGPRDDDRSPPHPDEVPDLRDAIEASGYFCDAAVRRHLFTVSFTSNDYVARLSTSSWHRALDDTTRKHLFERIHARIEAQPERAVTATLLATLTVGRRVHLTRERVGPGRAAPPA